MPTLVSHKEMLFRVRDGMPLADHEVRVPVTERLYSFAKERAYARHSECIQLESGVYDLHPDIRFAPEEAPPSE